MAFLEAWLWESAGTRVRPKTLRRYQELVRLHITPEIGRMPLARLSPQHVEKMLSGVAAKGASPRTVEHCRSVLRNPLHYAMRHSMVGRNVAALADAPPVPIREVSPLTPDAARRVLQAVHGDRLKPLFNRCPCLRPAPVGDAGPPLGRRECGRRHPERSTHSTAGQRGFHILPSEDGPVQPYHSHACTCSGSPTPAHEAPVRGTSEDGGSMGRRYVGSTRVHRRDRAALHVIPCEPSL